MLLELVSTVTWYSVKIINFVNIDSTSASIVPIFDMFLLKLYPLSNSVNAWFAGKQGVE